MRTSMLWRGILSGHIDSHALSWVLDLGMRTPMLWLGILRWGYGLPRFGVAPLVRDADFHCLA